MQRYLMITIIRLHAGFERDLVMVGMGRRFDIWSSEVYARVNAQDECNFPQDSASLASLGI